MPRHPYPACMFYGGKCVFRRPMQDIDHFRYALTEEANGYLAVGSPEAQVFNVVPTDGLPLAQLKVRMSGHGPRVDEIGGRIEGWEAWATWGAGQRTDMAHGRHGAWNVHAPQLPMLA